MRLGQRLRITFTTVALVGTGVLLAGCVDTTTSSDQAAMKVSARPTPTVTVTVTASPAPADQNIDAGYGGPSDAETCGEASALEGLADRAHYDETSGAISTQTYQTEMAVVGDGWANLQASPALFGDVKAVATQVKASPTTFDPNTNPADQLIEVVTVHCNKIGHVIRMMARPGEGG
jgi:hypothetical protein